VCAVGIDQRRETAVLGMHLEVGGLYVWLQCMRHMNTDEPWPLQIPHHPLSET